MQPVGEARRIPERHEVHGVVRPPAHGRVGVRACRARAGDAAERASHVRVVQLERVRRGLGVQERRVLRVGHLGGADVVGVRHRAEARRRVRGVAGVADGHGRDGDDVRGRRSGDGRDRGHGDCSDMVLATRHDTPPHA